jgi:hypothetical protein
MTVLVASVVSWLVCFQLDSRVEGSDPAKVMGF